MSLLVAQFPAAEQPIIKSVELRLPPGSDRALLEGATSLVLLRPGQPLTRKAARRTVERLMETSRFTDVVVWVDEQPDGVHVVVALEPRALVDTTYVEGNQALTPLEILNAAKVQPGGEMYPERAAEAVDAVVALYRSRGYLESKVQISVTEGEKGVDVGFVVQEGPPTRLSQLTFAGDTGLPIERLLTVVGVDPGEVLEVQALNAGLERLRVLLRKERFWRARLEAPQIRPGGLVLIPIDAGPRFEIKFSGGRAFPDTLLRGVVAYDGGETLEIGLLSRLSRKVRDFFRYRGFHDARVEVVERKSPDGRRAVLRFQIDEGPQLVVRKLEFSGNRAVPDSELKAVLADVMLASAPTATDDHPLDDPLELEGRAGKVQFSDIPTPAPDQVLVEEAWQDAMRSMEVLYRDRGFTQVRVRLDRVDVKPEGAWAKVVVDEGPRALFQKVAVTGWPEDHKREAIEGAVVGEPFSERRVDVAQQSMLRALGRLGHLYAVIEPSWSVDAAGQVSVAFKVNAGPMVKVGNVVYRGLTRTNESVVRGQVELKPGDALDPERLYASQKNLVALGIFRSADVRILSPNEKDPVKDIVVEVKEAPRLSGEFGIGYFFAEGPRVVVDASYPNAFGSAINLSGRLRVFYFASSGLALTRQVDTSQLNALELFGGRVNLSAQNRGLLPANIGIRVDLVGERVFRQTYQFSRVAAVPGLDWTTNLPNPGLGWTRPRLSLALQGEIELSRVLPVTGSQAPTGPLQFSDQQRLRFLFGTFALATIRFLPTLDLRDDPVVPRKGVLVQLENEFTFDLYTRDIGNPRTGEGPKYVPVKFYKLSGTITGYVPLWPRTNLALSVRGGKIFPFTAESTTPPVKRFFLGGASSMRGFLEDGLIAQDVRLDLDQQVQNCRALASPAGCTDGARTLQSGAVVGSQGGELFALGKAEFRFPAIGAIDLGIFFEAGNLWLGAPNSFTLRTVAGAGVRYMTPIGPLALDVGVNLAPDRLINEPPVNLHFNIGYF